MEKTNGELSAEQINTLVQAGIIPSGVPNAIIKVFDQLCKSHNLSPAKKEIQLVGYKTNDKINGKDNWITKYTAIVGRDGLRIKAQRTGELVGIDNPQFDLLSNGEYKTPSMFAKTEFPISCTITIYRLRQGLKCPFTATVLFSEFNSGKLKWLTMPFHMIAKVAECHALKMGFGEELQGLYVEEEMAAFEDLQTPKKLAATQLEALEEIKQGLELCNDMDNLGSYFRQLQNENLVTPEIRNLFTNKKLELNGNITA